MATGAMPPRGARGFTLTEMAVVMAVIGLLLGSLLYTLSAQTEQRNFSDNARRLEQARELILAFAVVNARLPCPAAAPPQAPYNNAGGTGVESFTAGAGSACTDGYTGFVPGKAIGFQPVDGNGYALDPWGNPLRYAVAKTTWSVVSGTGRFTTAHSANTSWSVSQTPNDLVICAAWGASTTACNTAATVTNTETVVAVIWSQGKNFPSLAAGGIASGGAGNDELANNKHRLPSSQNDHPVFVWHTPAPSGASGGEFDDQMVWIPIGELYARMLSAGILP
jgi:prepilin-type N-terminal cleavage/methylation domain-containing protein